MQNTDVAEANLGRRKALDSQRQPALDVPRSLVLAEAAYELGSAELGIHLQQIQRDQIAPTKLPTCPTGGSSGLRLGRSRRAYR